MQTRYFTSVRALPDYVLEAEMETGATIRFDFRRRFAAARYAALKDVKLFETVHTDGDYLIFNRGCVDVLKIGASEFMDMVLLDRAK